MEQDERRKKYERDIVKGFFNIFENTEDAIQSLAQALKDIAWHLESGSHNTTCLKNAAWHLEEELKWSRKD